MTATPNVARHKRVTGLSGNEIFCLNKLGMRPGNLCVGNSVLSLGVLGGFGAALGALAGGEITELTTLIQEGRANAIGRMWQEAQQSGGLGITGVTTELISHPSNIEFLSIGSTLHHHQPSPEHVAFSTSANAQELYCQLDAGFHPKQFVFGNVAYSIGIGGNIGGMFRSLKRGEVTEFSQIFDQTRHLALSRITEDAKRCGANSVVGIETTITPILGAQEMVMIGTASTHPMAVNFAEHPITSDMTNEEMWNMINIGYLPLRLVMGVSVYSLGVAGGIASAFQALGRGEVTNLTSLLYEAREKALDRIQRDAERWGADEVVGVKTHVYQLGGGLIEFLAIGTAVKKVDHLTTKSPNLPPQAVMPDRDTFFDADQGGSAVTLNDKKKVNARAAQSGPIAFIVSALFFLLYAFLIFFGRHGHH